VALILVPLVVMVGTFAFASAKFSQIPRAQVSGAFTPAIAGTNYLIVGTDSREGIKASDPNAGAFLGSNVAGARTDTIMVLHIENGHQSLLSIPRDLWVKDPSTGRMGRINSTYTPGPTNLIKAVQAIGIPIQHYAEINFVSFGKLVDSSGGIDINFAFPSRDTNSGLNIAAAGPNHLNGTAALAYVRSRHFEELKNGKWVTDPRSDLGRIDRQRQFLTALTNNVTNTVNPLALSNMADAMSAGLKIDDALNLLDALRLTGSMQSFHPASASLPVTPRTTNGGADVLDLKQPDAKTMTDQFNHGGLLNPPTTN
jgi:LCP family protein required for cell wall assembly